MASRPWCQCESDDCMDGLPIDEHTYIYERARHDDSPVPVYFVISGHESPRDEIVRRGIAKKGARAGEGYTVVRRADA
jgi:hypothetical protein